MTDPNITVGDCLKEAFAALLEGDTNERDRLCDLARMGFKDEQPVSMDKPIMETEGTKQ